MKSRLVMNWKPPVKMEHPLEVEKYFFDQGVNIEIEQTHRVRTGRLNTTFVGEQIEINKAWGIVKNLEKAEIIKNRKKAGKL
jgi:hypothetical protein